MELSFGTHPESSLIGLLRWGQVWLRQWDMGEGEYTLMNRSGIQEEGNVFVRWESTQGINEQEWDMGEGECICQSLS